jgi:glycerophosphoryl diester phosphodiesterase
MTTRAFELQGHRGARGLAPENTLAGCAAALAAGVTSIEIDVALTADGVVVLSHDPVLDPDLTRGPDGRWIDPPGARIRDLRFDDLARLDVGRARPGSAVARAQPDQMPQDGAGMPTLDAVFAATAAAATVVIDVEIKTDPRDPDLTSAPEAVADAVMASAHRSGAMARLAVRSFDWRSLFHMQVRFPNVPLGWLSEPGTCNADWQGRYARPGGSTPEAVAAAAGGTPGALWAPAHDSLTEAEIAKAHGLGLRVVPWTVNAADDMARLIRWGVDGLCTDRPDIARRVMAAAGLPLPPAFPPV